MSVIIIMMCSIKRVYVDNGIVVESVYNIAEMWVNASQLVNLFHDATSRKVCIKGNAHHQIYLHPESPNFPLIRLRLWARLSHSFPVLSSFSNVY